MTLVHENDGVWTPIHGVQTLQRAVATYTATYHDGRQAEVACDPYPVAETLDLGKVEQLLADGLWAAAALAPYGLRVALTQDVPQGKQRTGAPRYVERKGEIIEEWELEDMPPAPADPTPSEKLAALGLSIADLKALMAGQGA